MLSQLPFQQGSPLSVIQEQGSTEILHASESTGSMTSSTLPYSHSRDIFMLRPPLHPPQASHVLSDDETPSMVSDEDPEPPQ